MDLGERGLEFTKADEGRALPKAAWSSRGSFGLALECGWSLDLRLFVLAIEWQSYPNENALSNDLDVD